jgi:AraC-like DNA-binding protein
MRNTLATTSPAGAAPAPVTRTDDAGCARSSGGLAPWQKRRIAEVLGRDPARRIRLPDLAQLCGISTSHFARSFRTSFGVSAHQWLVRLRVDRSKDLLIHTRHALADIAVQAGFGDQAVFTRTFGRLVGTSPGRWRRYHRAHPGLQARAFRPTEVTGAIPSSNGSHLPDLVSCASGRSR